MSSWKKYKLGEIADRITSGGTPSTRKSEYYGGIIPWLRTQEVNFNRIYDTEIKITEDAIKNSSAKFIEENSIIIAMYGATAGRIAINKIPLTTNQACCNITIDKNKADYNYVYYFLKSKFEEILKLATGAAQQNLNAGMLRDFEILAPDLATQSQIAQILTSFDDKIELLGQMNQTLETMAQAIFKEWFVDFNFPKMSELGLGGLYDDRIEEKKKEILKSTNPKNPNSDKLPKGWRMGKLGSVSTLIAGGDKPKNSSSQLTELNSIPIYSNGITNDGLYGFTNSARISEESVTVSARGTIGFVCLRLKPYVPIVRLISVIPKQEFVSAKYLYFWLKSKNISGTGTTQQQLTVPDFSGFQVLVPQAKVVNEFTLIANSFFDKIEENKNQIHTLSQLRDNLLPKLMSGAVVVSGNNADTLDVGALSEKSAPSPEKQTTINNKT